MNIEELEGVGPSQAEKLRKEGVTSVEKLLEMGGTPSGRQKLAEATGIADSKIMKYVNHADLIRLDGVGPQFAELLEAAGVDTVKELARRNPENLAEKMREVNDKRNLVNRLPSATTLEKMIQEAKSLPDILHH